jgi:hypothetical protein
MRWCSTCSSDSVKKTASKPSVLLALGGLMAAAADHLGDLLFTPTAGFGIPLRHESRSAHLVDVLAVDRIGLVVAEPSSGRDWSGWLAQVRRGITPATLG